MNKSLVRNTILAFLFLIGGYQTALATHIIGGEMNYRCLGNDQYQVSLTVYRDCFLGEAPLDDTAYVAVFDATNKLVQTLPILLGQIDTIVQNDPCLIIPPNICVETTTYVDTVTLSIRTGGYRLVYQRCCRNGTILNIVDPLNTGATYDIQLREAAMRSCNSSPVLSEWPPTFVCVNRSLTFNSAATDPEGDSITYRLCAPLKGGTSIDRPRPRPALPPPYDTIVWNSPTYNLDNLLGGVPLKIDAKTGVLTGTPNMIGQFVVGICVDEYRNGQLLSSTRRDFQYNAIPCQDVVAQFSVPATQCEGSTVRPINETEGDPNGFLWKFFDENDRIIHTSNEANPAFNFPDTGRYAIRLIVNRGSICADSTEQAIVIEPNTLMPDFQYTILGCADSLTLQFTDNSSVGRGFIDDWTWTFDGEIDQFISLEQNPQLTILNSQQLTVNLNISTNSGCESEKLVELDAQIIPDSFSVSEFDTLIVCRGDSIELNPIFDPTLTYSWSPSTGLNDVTSPNPKAFPDTSTAYLVMIRDSSGNCELQKNVFLEVIDFDNTFDFSIDTLTCGDSVQLQLIPNPTYDLSKVNLVWEIVHGSQQFTLQGTSPILTIANEENIMTSGTVSDAFGCSKTVDKQLQFNFIKADLPNQLSVCRGDSIELNPNFNPAYQYQWSPAELFADPTAANPKIAPINSTNISVTISQTSTSCPLEKSIELIVLSSIAEADFDFTVSGCSDSIVLNITHVNTQPIGLINEVAWELVGTLENKNSTERLPTFTLQNSQSVELTLTVNPNSDCPKSITKSFDFNLLADIELADTLTICQGESIALNPSEQFPNYVYSWTPAASLDNATAINPTATPNQTTTYQLTYSDSTQLCQISKMVTVEVLEKIPAIDADITVACDGRTVQITPNSNGLIRYDFGDNSLDVVEATDNFILHNYKSAGDFTLLMQYVNPTVCPDSVTKTITLPEQNFAAQFAWNVEACNNNVAQLELIDLSENSFGTITERNWQLSNGMVAQNDEAPVFSITESTELTATLVITLDNDASCRDSVQLTIPPLVVDEMIADTLIDCAGTTVELNPDFNENYSYSWTPKEGLSTTETPNPTVELNEARQYKVQISNEYDCQILDSIFTDAAPTIDIKALDVPVVCDTMEVVLMAESEQTDQLVWTNEEGDTLGAQPELLVMVDHSQNFTATFTDQYNCQNKATVAVDFQAVRLGYESTQSACENQPTNLVINNLVPSDDLTFEWSPSTNIINGETTINPEVQLLETATFAFTAVNGAGCESEGTVTVEVNPLPQVNADAEPAQIFEGETSQLIVTNNPNYTYKWMPSNSLDNPTISNPVASPTVTTDYTLIVTDENGCVNQATTNVSIREGFCDFPYIFVPSGFTPNGDGQNDVLFVRGDFIDELTFVIYDRWGDKVFETTDQEIGWDGTRNGRPLPSGVFGYFLRTVCKNGDRYSRQGNVTLIR
ncbi:MAG: gliding motility-associated C-terminal domain-containing protein [Bacteroidota bacterium]